MAFSTTIDNTQKVLDTITLAKADGSPVTVDGLVASVVSGDGAFSMTDSGGNPLPTNQIFYVSGPGTGDTVIALNIQNAVRPTIDTVTLTVVEGVLNVIHSLGTPEPK